ncbi:MAG TPA: hypothetical protein VK638_35500 [Edaphobacter sp.]|nr:hypothetical protein [Edaphobacter sp.]
MNRLYTLAYLLSPPGGRQPDLLHILAADTAQFRNGSRNLILT